MDLRSIFSHRVLRTILFAIFLINGVIYIPSQSITGDENAHYRYGVNFVKGHPEKEFDDASTMPLSAFNSLPRAVEQVLFPNTQKNDDGVTDLFHGRYVTLLISAFIGLMVYRWSRKMYGDNAALASLFLFTFCPNLNAHASLVTTDSFSALFTILPLFYLWQFLRSKRNSHFIWFVIWLSVAQLAKQSLTWLYPIVSLMIGIFGIYFRSWQRVSLKASLKYFAEFFVITLLVLNIGFQCKGTGSSLDSYAFRSSFFSNVQRALKPLGALPLPVPTPYLYGLDYTKAVDEIGGGHPESSGNIYLLGESRSGRGFKTFYFVVGFFKTPIPLLIGILLAFLMLFRSRFRNFMLGEFFLLFPVFCFLAYFNFFYRSQVGLRHVLMIYPLLIVFTGKSFNGDLKFPGKPIMAGLALWSVTTFYFYFPLLMPYTNEFVLDKKNAYKLMADSNLDYDNAFYYLQKYLEKNPTVRYASPLPDSGRFVINTLDFLDLNNTGRYRWLRANFEPVGHVAFTYLRFDISEQQLKDHRLLK